MSPTSGPTSSPSMAPTITPVVTIAMDATLFWNITCPLNGTAEEVANIISQSVYDGTVEETDGLQYVYVYELCGEEVSSTPYPPRRRLQAGESAIRLKSIITSTCNGCEDDMFNQAEEALRKIVEDGSLSENIQDNSGDEITAVINTTITDTSSEVITNPPTAAPANPTTEAPIASRKITETPTLSPITSAPVSQSCAFVDQRISLHCIIDFLFRLHVKQSMELHALTPVNVSVLAWNVWRIPATLEVSFAPPWMIHRHSHTLQCQAH